MDHPSTHHASMVIIGCAQKLGVSAVYGHLVVLINEAAKILVLEALWGR